MFVERLLWQVSNSGSESYGEVAAGKVSVHLLTDYRTPNQRYVMEQIPLNDRDAMIEIEVKEGHRKTSILEASLAQVEANRKTTVKNLTARRSRSRSESQEEATVQGLEQTNRTFARGNMPDTGLTSRCCQTV